MDLIKNYGFLMAGVLLTFLVTLKSFLKNRKENKKKAEANTDHNWIFTFTTIGLFFTLLSGIISTYDKIKSQKLNSDQEHEKTAREAEFKRELAVKLDAQQIIVVGN
jgi:predicted histidine transporter YuiF (NhaC family)